jgi:circadian clock protein KaiC
MASADATFPFPELTRLPTGVPGLDTVMHGGLVAGDAYLVRGTPGTGKTTLGNQLAFAHAVAGGRAIIATLLTETHERMLAHLRTFAFADPALVGERIQYISLLTAMQEGGTDGAINALVPTIQKHRATLLIIDGAGGAELFAPSRLDFSNFIHSLQARTAFLGCTTVMLSGNDEAIGVATHVDGVVELSNEPTESRDVRWLRVVKLRGSDYLNGRHAFAIDDHGVTVFPRLEAASTDLEPTWPDAVERLPFGVAGFDAMTAGGMAVGSSALVFGTPGAGKTLLGLHFIAEGARRGEPGLIASFQEPAQALASTADQAGMGLGPHIESGLVRVMWRPPLELVPDEWVWQLLAAVDEHQPRRVVVDAFSDLARTFPTPQRLTRFATAMTNELRARHVTSLFLLEIDQFAGPDLTLPIPNVSATMDTGILLRTVELRSSLRRLVSILKERQTAFDHTIREFTIGPAGITVEEPFAASALLTGTAVPIEQRS